LRLICDNTGVNKTAVGKIDIMNNFSFFDADKSEAPLIMSKLKGIDFEGKEMTIEETKRGENPADTGHEEGFRKRKPSFGKSEGGFRKRDDGYRKSDDGPRRRDDGFKKKTDGFRKGASSSAGYREKSEGAKERNKYKSKSSGDRDGAPARKRSYKN
jgi:ATP-dependent RNA helicase DeaD